MYNKFVSITNIKKDLQKFADPIRAEQAKRYFKTGKGEYGEGDIFLGLTTPQLTSVVKNYLNLDLADLQELLNSKIHEYRCVAVVILRRQFDKRVKDPLFGEAGQESRRVEEIYNFYLKNTKNINNWDLVDISCPTIVGGYLLDKDRAVLNKLAKSDLLWERRIAIISTFAFIREGQFGDTLKISEILLNDNQDLIHKAVGWALREVGKKDIKVLEDFLNKFLTIMPRTTLRYAIEKFPEEKRMKYLDRPIK